MQEQLDRLGEVQVQKCNFFALFYLALISTIQSTLLDSRMLLTVIA